MLSPLSRAAALLALLAAAIAAPAAPAAVLPPAVIDTNPGSITDIAIAPDGTGALVYVKGDELWASLLDGATWGAPFRIDLDQADPEDQPRVAAGNGGRVLFGYRDSATVLNRRLIAS